MILGVDSIMQTGLPFCKNYLQISLLYELKYFNQLEKFIKKQSDVSDRQQKTASVGGCVVDLHGHSIDELTRPAR